MAQTRLKSNNLTFLAYTVPTELNWEEGGDKNVLNVFVSFITVTVLQYFLSGLLSSDLLRSGKILLTSEQSK